MKKILLTLAIFIFPIGQSLAHSLPTELMDYILANPKATLSELQAQAEETNPNINFYTDEARVGMILNLPGKREIAFDIIEMESPNVNEVNKMIAGDPILTEIGAEEIINFLHAFRNPDEAQTSFEQAETVNPTEINFLGFIWLGVIHILGGPDHILFILSLLLLLPTTKRTLWMLTTFTVAHSVTLLLAGLKIITLSANIVEPLIALSISTVAVATLWKKVGDMPKLKQTLIPIFAFGLFHGLGFAGVFAEYRPETSQMLSAVFGFNIGVELGQITLVLVALPLLHLIYRWTKQNHLKNTFAILIAFAGLIWFIERL